MTMRGARALGNSRGALVRWPGVCGAVASLLVAAVAVPAASAAGTQTGTIWVPLYCALSATIDLDIGAAFTVTVPTSVPPGGQFDLQNAIVRLDIPPAAINALELVFHNPDEVEGAVTTFDTNLSDATAPTLVNADTSRTTDAPAFVNDPVVGNYPATAGNWAEAGGTAGGGVDSDPNVGAPTASPAIVNLVAAAQPPNTDAPSPLVPEINGGSPLAGFADFPEPPLEGVFSWGPAPVPSVSPATVGAYAPAPGDGGGSTPTSGTPIPASIGPIQVTGPVGGVVTLGIGNPDAVVQTGSVRVEPAVDNDIFFLETTGPLAGQYSADVPVECGIDTTSSAVPSPDPSYLPVSTGIKIPIVSPPPTTITSISPARGPVAGGNAVTITGDGFSASPSGDVVEFGSTAATVTSASSTSLTVIAPPAAAAGPLNVTVTTAGGTEGPVTYTYVAPTTPVVSGVFPHSGRPFSLVFITGKNLGGASKVTFGGQPAPFLGLGARSVLALAPAGVSGTVDVQVTTTAGTSATSGADHFSYTRR